MKLLFENWRKFVNEEASNSKIEDTVVDVLKDEGGAAGLEPIKKAAEDLDLPDGFDLKDFLKGLRDVGQHEDGDYILDDGEEIDVKEGVEIFLEAQEEMLDEKRKRKKKKKKKKKRDACYHKVKARYKVWPSAYASGALVKCRKKGAKNWGTGGKKKKKNESLSLEDMIREEIQNVLDEKGPSCWKGYRKNPSIPSGPGSCIQAEELEEEENSLNTWFSQNKGKGWKDCKTGKPCGRQKGEKRKGYPACRPTMAQCTEKGKRAKKSSKEVEWK